MDRSRTVSMAEAPVGEEVTIVAEIKELKVRRPRRNLAMIEATVVADGDSMDVVWFNQTFRQKQLPPGTEVALSGKLERFRGKLQMKSPAVDVLSSDSEGLTTGRVVPIHPSLGDLGPGHVRRAVHNALVRSRPISDPLPEDLVSRLAVMPRDQAFADIHFPESVEAARPARRRLVFDELFRLELALALQKRRQLAESRGVSHDLDGELSPRFVAGLPYTLTGAQQRVLSEIRADLAADHPMHRLLQGEVGSGKTAVAVAALLIAVQGGFQGAIMAPTEVLAVQHYLAVQGLLQQAGLAPPPEQSGERMGMSSLFSGDIPMVRMAVLTSSQAMANFDPGAGRPDILQAIGGGAVDLVVGTHALIQEGVAFARLGIAVVDEQHRFGVAQRVMLRDKGSESQPDLLIMTATPIPRTLAMTLYGDLDVSLLEEMPPGRSPVKTTAVGRSGESRAWELVKKEANAGRQSFVVCPLVEDSLKIEAVSATAEHERLRVLLPDLRLGLIHGQLPPRDKEAVMNNFRSGHLDVLVATTVIEVGIDIPNATVMVVEDADRFGLSQLHQLRGRVGRGQAPGHCVLLADPTTEEGEARIAAMLATNDGFRLAEEDLRMRGQGTVFGAKQSGMPDLRLADILTDVRELVDARREAFALVDQDPDLTLHPELREEIQAFLGERVEWLFKS
jgi:ATP-dependent DNA helicase RecG